MCYRIHQDKIILTVLTKPQSKKNLLYGMDAKHFLIAVAAKAHDNQANKALIHYLATLLAVPKSQLCLIRGAKSRYKQIALPYSDKLLARLEKLACQI